MIDVVVGPKSDSEAVDSLLERLAPVSMTGTIYVGYPLVALPTGVRPVDLLLTCREHGIVIFDFQRGAATLARQDIVLRQRQLRQAVEIALARSGRLSVAGKLIVEPRVLTLDPDIRPGATGFASLSAPRKVDTAPASITVARPKYSARPPQHSIQNDQPAVSPFRTAANPRATKDTGDVASWDDVLTVLSSAPPIDAATLRFINAAIHRLGASRPAPFVQGLGPLAGPRAAILGEISAQVANLDQWQKAAAIEMPEGPQRIRGLAGTGKTVVLAFKAAYLHALKPQWTIVLTFYTRTLYEPLRDLVRKFYREHTGGGGEPNWDRLQLRHAWGAKERGGVYREIAGHVGVQPVGISQAIAKYGKRRTFESVCKNILVTMNQQAPEPLYDAVLIDEAQDLPAAFLEMVYRVTTAPHRIVWAYDDLQNVSDYEPTSPAKLFGTLPDGRARVPELINVDGEARSDIILPICYRNTQWALTAAHALGLGVYRIPGESGRGTGLVQFYDDPEFWEDIGYVVREGTVAAGQKVTLSRDPRNTPPYFERLLDPSDAVTWQSFPDSASEAEWVAIQVATNLERDGLSPREILIVSANPFFSESDGVPLVRALHRVGVLSHIAGSAGRRDELFGTEGSLPIAHINRAKGNEAAMVYVVHSEYGAETEMIVRRRNTLFSAVTRSGAWVRITGAGEGMRKLERELALVRANNYTLSFTAPTALEAARIRKLHRDISPSARRRKRDARFPRQTP